MARFNPNDYVDVQSRITRFWTEYPDGRIETDLMSSPDNFDQVVFKASVYKHRDNTSPDATGWAAEKAGGGGANQTSWHENGETSAIGRALANLGYATSQKDRPSREEMRKASQDAPQAPVRTDNRRYGHVADASPEAPQTDAQGVTAKQEGLIRHLIKTLEWSRNDVESYLANTYGAHRVSELSKQDVSRFIDHLQSLKAANEPAPAGVS